MDDIEARVLAENSRKADCHLKSAICSILLNEWAEKVC